MKEKLLAAHRGKIQKVLIPKENKKDLKDIPKKILKELQIVQVEHMDDVLSHALVLDDPKKLFGKNKPAAEGEDKEKPAVPRKPAKNNRATVRH